MQQNMNDATLREYLALFSIGNLMSFVQRTFKPQKILLLIPTLLTVIKIRNANHLPKLTLLVNLKTGTGFFSKM
jgi:hypothetical protein